MLPLDQAGNGVSADLDAQAARCHLTKVSLEKTEWQRSGAKRRITEEGGQFPVWARGGPKLFFHNQGQLWAVEAQTEPTLTWEDPLPLFKSRKDVEWSTEQQPRYAKKVISTRLGTDPLPNETKTLWRPGRGGRSPVELNRPAVPDAVRAAGVAKHIDVIGRP